MLFLSHTLREKVNYHELFPHNTSKEVQTDRPAAKRKDPQNNSPKNRPHNY